MARGLKDKQKLRKKMKNSYPNSIKLREWEYENGDTYIVTLFRIKGDYREVVERMWLIEEEDMEETKEDVEWFMKTHNTIAKEIWKRNPIRFLTSESIKKEKIIFPCLTCVNKIQGLLPISFNWGCKKGNVLDDYHNSVDSCVVCRDYREDK